MKNILNSKISVFSLIKYTFPTVIMMVFFAMYSIVDGMFVSRYVGPNALSSINIVYPMISLLIGVSVMLATGGNAIVSKLMGENKESEARKNFTLIAFSAVVIGMVIATLSLLFIKFFIKFPSCFWTIYPFFICIFYRCKFFLSFYSKYSHFIYFAKSIK